MIAGAGAKLEPRWLVLVGGAGADDVDQSLECAALHVVLLQTWLLRGGEQPSGVVLLGRKQCGLATRAGSVR